MEAEELAEKLDYDSATGVFTWRWRDDVEYAWNKRNAGKIAGTPDKDGYIMVRINGRSYKAHRLAWLMSHKELPRDNIDHVNGRRDDNRIMNLRQASQAQNTHNSSGWRKKDLPKGVQRRCDGKAFVARIMVNGVFRHIGSFQSIEDARAAYESVAAELQGEFASSLRCE